MEVGQFPLLIDVVDGDDTWFGRGVAKCKGPHDFEVLAVGQAPVELVLVGVKMTVKGINKELSL